MAKRSAKEVLSILLERLEFVESEVQKIAKVVRHMVETLPEAKEPT